MKLLLDGSLNQSLQLKDLLSGISQAEAPGLSVLKFAVNKEECGEIYFLGGHYIVCARLNANALEGETALTELLQLKEAVFVYYACDSIEALPPQSDNLQIDLKALIDEWQEIKPISEDELLDKIFNVSAPGYNQQIPEKALQQKESQAMPVTANREVDSIVEENSIPFGSIEAASGPVFATGVHTALAPRDDVDWDLVEPLVSSGAPGSGTASSDWSPNVQAPSSHDIRLMWRGFQWQRALRKVFLFFVVIMLIGIAVASGIWLLINAPSAHLGPRRYVVPIERHFFHKAP